MTAVASAVAAPRRLVRGAHLGVAITASVLAVASSAVLALPHVLDGSGSPTANPLPAWLVLAVAVAAAASTAGTWAALRQSPRSSMALGLATLAATVQLWSSQEWLPAGLRAATLA